MSSNNSTDRNDTDGSTFVFSPWSYLLSLICIAGIIGNGIVITFLGFWIKRNSFTVYIINLAVADNGTLVFLFLSKILHLPTNQVLPITVYFISTYCTGHLLLTIIGIDRCLALFFPIWYRCLRSQYLSTKLCAITWIIAILLCAVHNSLILVKPEMLYNYFHILIFALVGMLLVVVSSLVLLIKGYLQSRMKRQGRLHAAILLALFFFLIFSIPPVVIYLKDVLFKRRCGNLITYGYLCACLNSSVNPLIYFLLGRKKELKTMCNLKISLQRLFEEKEEDEKQPEVQVDSQL
ncbi:proto-oncogene Mas-like [Vipera latastei]